MNHSQPNQPGQPDASVVDGYADKIAKLLAKAEGTDNPHEAETFTKNAERLMIKWGVEEALVRAKMTGGDKPAETIVQRSVTYTDTYSDAFVTFSNSIVSGLGQLRCMYVVGRMHEDERHFYVIGFASDVERAHMLLASLRLQAISAMHKWWKTSDERTYLKGWRAFKARRQFIMSFGAEVGRRLINARAETVAEMGGMSTELVLRDRKTLVDQWMDEHHKLKSGKGLEYTHGGAAAGRAAGANADLGDDRLSGPAPAIETFEVGDAETRGPGFTKTEATKRARTLRGRSVSARPATAPGRWTIGGVQDDDVWIVVSRDRTELLDDGRLTEDGDAA